PAFQRQLTKPFLTKIACRKNGRFWPIADLPQFHLLRRDPALSADVSLRKGNRGRGTSGRLLPPG
ncbi:hypothetical protein, partial [Dechloromonas sp. ZS-1]|uniref:hypothetical protein n=1 Tax=Dechloromonas sp. ZS-1 TaxID=3138067 RepID=UPI0031FD6899